MRAPLRGVLLSTVVSACLAGSAVAQGFHAVHSSDGADVWAVGDQGTWYRSFDGGLNWSSGALGAGRLRDVASRGFGVMAVGDSGKIWVSANSGGAWRLEPVAGAPELRAVALPAPGVAVVAGEGGLILKSADGGETWTTQVSGTASRLNALRFVDADNGWAVGENGTVLATSDGGESWSAVAVPSAQPLHGVDQLGSRVWVVGGAGTALRSLDGGASFEHVDLQLESGSDVRAVCLTAPDSVYIAGGGGFIRVSGDGGATWEFGIHSQHGQISDLCFAGGLGFAASNRNRVVLSTVTRGRSWRMPAGAALTRLWVQKLPFVGQVRGNTFALHPTRRSTLYCTLGSTVYRSTDEGESWSSIATIPSCTKVNAFLVSPRDTNTFLAAVAGIGPKRLVRSDDHGLTWFTTLEHDFGDYGVPLEMDVERPDTVYFGGDGSRLHRSTDGGKNWERISNNSFRSPCDIVAVPGAPNIILLGDGVTGNPNPPGQYWRSVDGGVNFSLIETRPTSASEIPGMACSRLRNWQAFGTNWGAGGVQRSFDYGASWPGVHTATQAWGVDIARDDPNVVVFGVYSGGQSYVSVDSGTTFLPTPLGGSNYGFHLRDRGLILAMQSNGIYKMSFNYNHSTNNAQFLFLTYPNGGETFTAGEEVEVTWNATNIAVAHVEYRRAPGEPWQRIAEVPGHHRRHAWRVPNEATEEAMIRVRDGWDAAPEDSSNGAFTIVGGVASAPRAGAPELGLWQNRPNPFTGLTEIGFSLPTAGEVSLEVFDLQGQRVATLARGLRPAGSHRVAFGAGAGTADGGRVGALPAGVYFYRFRAGGYAATRKMLLMR